MNVYKVLANLFKKKVSIMERYELDEIYSFVASQLLGDGTIAGNCGIKIRHCAKQHEYLKYKFQISQTLGLSSSGIKVFNSNTTFGIVEVSETYISVPHDSLYFTDPVELVYRLTPLGLLLWWLDDGSLAVHVKKNKDGIQNGSVARFGYLSTEAFDEETNVRISLALFEIFGFKCPVHTDQSGIYGPSRKYFRLYFNAENMRLLIDIVRPYIGNIPLSMLYKIHMGYYINRNKINELYMQQYNFI